MNRHLVSQCHHVLIALKVALTGTTSVGYMGATKVQTIKPIEVQVEPLPGLPFIASIQVTPTMVEWLVLEQTSTHLHRTDSLN